LINAGKAKGMTPQQWIAARQAGEPVTLADLGSSQTQALIRSSANTSPEGRAMLEKMIEDRFLDQSVRVADTVRNLVSGGANAGKTADQLVAEYDLARTPAYIAAFRHPQAQGMWNTELSYIAQAPAVQQAIRMAMVNAKNEAAKLKIGAPKNPFVEDASGRITLRQLDPNDPASVMKPNLQFWDVVKKNLDAMKTPESMQWARVLREELDQHVPQYAHARGIAATFFGERDALEAGRKLASKKIDPDELKKVLRSMNPLERDLFREGYVHDWAGRVIGEVRDTRDITKAMFNSPNERERARIVLGPAGLAKVEARIAATKDPGTT
jgi:hypothetical protein